MQSDIRCTNGSVVVVVTTVVVVDGDVVEVVVDGDVVEVDVGTVVVVVVGVVVVVVVGTLMGADSVFVTHTVLSDVLATIPNNRMGTIATTDKRCCEDRIERTSATPATMQNRATMMRLAFPPALGSLQASELNIRSI